jgi:hypothetical protein
MLRSVGVRRLICAAGAVCLPFLVATAYLYFSRFPEPQFSDTSDFAAFSLALGICAACVWLVPVRWYWRLVGSIVVIPAVGFGLIVYAFDFVCRNFRDCL